MEGIIFVLITLALMAIVIFDPSSSKKKHLKNKNSERNSGKVDYWSLNSYQTGSNLSVDPAVSAKLHECQIECAKDLSLINISKLDGARKKGTQDIGFNSNALARFVASQKELEKNCYPLNHLKLDDVEEISAPKYDCLKIATKPLLQMDQEKLELGKKAVALKNFKIWLDSDSRFGRRSN